MAGKRGDEGTGEAKDGMVSDRGPAGGNAAASSLDRQTGVALWRQIADDIRAAIGNGVYDDSTKLPTEAALAAQFEVNRHTVRQALGALAREGIVETVQGRGTTVVRRTRFSYPIGSRTRFSAGLGGQVSSATARMLSAQNEPAGEVVATALHLSEGDPVIRVELVGEADGTPLSRSTHWFDARRFEALPDALARLGSMTAALRECGVADYRRAQTEISAASASRADRADLALQPGAVVLRTRALNVTGDGSPIQFSLSRFPADRVSLSVSPDPDDADTCNTDTDGAGRDR
uniref:phosphonate metabolism transcriptional regulator PhnF n=1 Tax=Stappia sp. TaxID=1870903 RepID=UPI003BAA61F6